MGRIPRSPLVVNCELDEFDVFIGRPGPWGNPFREGPFTTRTQVIARYERWIRSRPELVRRIRDELRGKRLGCFCRPKACHGDVLAMIAEETEEDLCL
jgi:hypothetical protein